ncbi:MAG: EAL domain-containing protein [Gammaproteobacteria bacterium]|nr:EAL domain-containing protein [Gammaproteobacteria bacterium]
MFHLVRYFSIASLVTMLIAALIMGLMYRDIAQENLLELGENKNAALAQVFANTLWPYYSQFVPELEILSADDIRRHPVTNQIRRDISLDTQGLDVVKVKLYTNRGLTIFSTDYSQIGADKSSNPDFLKALQGGHATEMDSRQGMLSLDGSIKDRNLISSYIPIRNHNNGTVEGVFELYSDVTPVFKQIKQTENNIYFGVIVLFSLLYLALFTIIKRADTIIKQHEEQLRKSHEMTEYQAMHDSLTDLPNRCLLQDRMEHALLMAERNETLVAVLFIDLDRFKPINDSLGHAVGDELLKQIAKRLLKAVRDCDTVSRVGGDEFVIILESLTNVEQANVVAERILESLARPIVIQGNSLHITSSIGIAFHPFEEGEFDIEKIIKNADAAMYAVKKSGRNTFEMFSANMRFETDARAGMEQKLYPALKNNEFELHFQPLLETRSGKLASLEALIRWNSPELGLVQPLDFIPALEDSGLIIDVGYWIIGDACRVIKQLDQQANHNITVNVNVSSKQLRQPDFSQRVAEIIIDAGIKPSRLDFEITESVLVEDVDTVVKQMTDLRELGVSFSIDDFGVGYSSLNYLKRIPVQTLKIDRDFVRELNGENQDVAILDAIASLAKSLNLQTVAEGIETEDQYRIVLRKEIDFVQGYMFCKPCPFDSLLEKFTINDSGMWLTHRLERNGTD